MPGCAASSRWTQTPRTDISGATAASYTLPATSLADHGQWFRAVAANSAGSATSNGAVLGVTASPAGKAWSTPTLISNEFGQGSAPKIAVDASGNAIALWAQAISGPPNTRVSVFANRYDTASGWGMAGRLETESRANDNFQAQVPQVAFASSGDAIAVWQSGTGVISAAAFTNGAWEAQLDIGPGASGISRDPQIIFDSNGTGIAIWSQNSGPSSMPSIFVSRYE